MNWKEFSYQENPNREGFFDRKFINRASPYAIPKAYRVYTNEKDSFVCLEFKYIAADDEFVANEPIDGIVIHYGKDSKRIYTIKIRMMNLHNESELLENLEKLRAHFEKSKTKYQNSRNMLNNYMIKTHGKDLLDEIK
jgi:hypothetical protein